MWWALALAAGAVGWLVAALLVRRPPGFFSRPRHRRENFRGRGVVAGFGIVLLVPLGIGAAFSVWGGWTGLIAAGAGAVMGVVGYIDDLYAARRAGGFLGHLRALRHGHVTTGLAKALAGSAVGFPSAWLTGLRGGWIVAGGLLVALAANFVNLVDLRPGRASKVWLVAWVLTLVSGPAVAGAVVATALAGGLLALLPADLGERVMLGDAGANLLGATLGVVALTGLGPAGLVGVVVVLAGLTAVSEVVSFSRVIERLALLRALDGLGRRP